MGIIIKLIGLFMIAASFLMFVASLLILYISI